MSIYPIKTRKQGKEKLAKMTRFIRSFAAAALGSLLFTTFTFGHVRGDDNDVKTRDRIPVTVIQAAGPTASSIQGAVDAFRTALGGVNNGNGAPAATGRREINWDGGGSTATAPGATPFDVFLNTRGGRFVTPGSGFVQIPVANVADFFGNLGYANIFSAFSPVRLFSPVGSNETEAQFFVPGGGLVPAITRGFGAVFTDIDQPDGSGPGRKRGIRQSSTLLEYYDADGNLIFSSFAPASPGDGSLSFFGIVFDDPRIAKVIITTDGVPGEDDTQRSDVVLMDDFLYGEPQPIQ
jgi:hypothetical protein